jgi:hypothetical protein
VNESNDSFVHFGGQAIRKLHIVLQNVDSGGLVHFPRVTHTADEDREGCSLGSWVGVIF